MFHNQPVVGLTEIGKNICHGLARTDDYWSQGTDYQLSYQTFPSIYESYTDHIYLTLEDAFIVGIQIVVRFIGVS